MERDMFSVTLQMRKLRERAGLSMDEMARALGYARASSIQRYENENEFSKDYFSVDLTQKIARALIGRGNPPIMADEVWALSLPDARAKLFNQDATNDATNKGALVGAHGVPADNWRPIRSTMHQGDKRPVLAHGSFAEADSNERG
ncbi:MAG: helix-turn-helix transcriptional regulator, partial [Bartonella sp.]|nr:helix-turn-helix transcriptional regulator [Bartonella sp.]